MIINIYCRKNCSLGAVFLALFLILSFNVFAQKYSFKDTYPEKNSDSLERWLVLNPRIDENRLKNLIKIERSYSWELSINRYKYLTEIEKVAQKLKNKNGILYFKMHKAELLDNESQNDRAVKLLTEALHIAEGLNDTSAQISILSYLCLMYIYHNGSETENLAKYYILKAKTLVNSTTDPHSKILFLMVNLKYEPTPIGKLSMMGQLMKLYNTTPSLDYTFTFVKFIETSFYIDVKNYNKALEINKELNSKVKPNNFHLLSRIYLNYAKNYNGLLQYEQALKFSHLAIQYFHKPPKIAYMQSTGETTYSTLINIFRNERDIDIKLGRPINSNALADSIIYYQKLELDNSKKTIHQIQTLYNFEWSELEQKDLATEKKLSQLIQISLQNKLQIEQKKMEALLFKNEFEKAAKVIIQIKQNSEKQIALAKSQIIEDTNQRLNNYLWIISVLLIFMIISLIFLRKYYYREKQITSFRDKFYTILTHDLRGSINSLTNMGGVLGYLIRTKNTAAMEQVANQIDYLGYSTSLLLDNMLDWGTAKSYGIDITAKSFDISLFLNELVARYLAAMKTKNITIFLNIPDNLIVKTSPKCLDIIIRNLIANANTNTPIGGRINIDVKENLETQQIKIIVSDTGDGIEAEKLDFIEKVFSRKITPEVGDSGLGLGIILISHFARKNNSTLNVTSQIGVGSCFTVVIDKQ
jgi:signal transduction histidine kinase